VLPRGEHRRHHPERRSADHRKTAGSRHAHHDPADSRAFQPRAYKVLEEAIFVVRDRIAGLELFDHPETLALKLPKLVRSYGLDAIDESAASEPCSIPTSERFLQGIASAQRSDDHAVGLGAHIRLQGAA